MLQVNFTPVNDDWKKKAEKTIRILSSKSSKFIKNLQLNQNFIYAKIAIFPLVILLNFVILIFKRSSEESSENS